MLSKLLMITDIGVML